MKSWMVADLVDVHFFLRKQGSKLLNKKASMKICNKTNEKVLAFTRFSSNNVFWLCVEIFLVFL